MSKKRSLETQEQASQRKRKDLSCKKEKQYLETQEQASERKRRNLSCKKEKQYLETQEQASERKRRNLSCKKEKQYLETQEQASQRKRRNLSCKQIRKAQETEESSLERKERNKQSASKRRKLETEERTGIRRQNDHACKSRRRLFIEKNYETEIRRQKDRDQHRSRLTSTIEKATAKFLEKIKIGAQFVCSCCNRLMYRNNVVLYNKKKYSNSEDNLLEKALCSPYISNDGNEYICKTCDHLLKRNTLPTQSVGNGLKLDEVPPELNKLNELEVRLISLRIPFMKLVSLPVGKQRGIHGPAVNVPTNIDTVCTALPRLPSESEIIPLKLKRKLCYKSYYMYDYVHPHNIIDALAFLKNRNPLYKDISINNDWVMAAFHDNEEFFSNIITNPPITVTDFNELNQSPVNTDNNNNTDVCPNDSNNSESLPPFVCSNTVSSNLNDVHPYNSYNSDDLPLHYNTLSCNVNAFEMLSAAAQKRGYFVHDVPGNGIASLNLSCTN